mgnify:CR=1 FL=1
MPPARRPPPVPRLATLAVACLAALAAAAQAQAPSRLLTGRVSDSASGQGLGGASVAVPGSGARTETAPDGRFRLAGLPLALVEVEVRLVGYRPFRRVVDLRERDGALEAALVAEPLVLPTLSVAGDSGAGSLGAVQSATRLSADDLARSRGQTLGETLRQIPGVTTIQFGPGVAKPVIRGLNSQRILVVNDGVRQEDQQWGTEHAPTIDAFDADAVTVVRGTGAVLYGPDALGGVVRLDRAPVPLERRVGGDLSVNSFTNNRQAAISGHVEAGGVSLPLVGELGLRARLTARVAGDAQAPDVNQRNTGFRELNASLQAGIHRDWGMGELVVTQFTTHLGILSWAHAGNVDDLARAMAGPPPQTDFSWAIDRPDQRVSHTGASLKARVDVADRHLLHLQYGFQYNHRREYDTHGPLRNQDIPAFDLTLVTNTLEARLDHAPLRGALRGSVGLSGLYQGNATDGKAFLIPGYDQVGGAVFAQEELPLGRVTLSAGARWDLLWQQTIAYADAGIDSPATERTWSGGTGSLGASYRLAPAWSVALRGSRGWRAPTVNERFAQGVHHGSAQYELGNQALAPEAMLGAEVALRHEGAAWQLEASGWLSRIDGFIYLRPREPVFTIRGAFPAFEYSQTDAMMRGAELLASWYATPFLNLSAGASLVRGTDRVTDQPLFDMPQDRATLSARLFGHRPWAGQAYAEVGAVVARRQDQVPPGTVYSLPTEGYWLLNVEVGATALRLGATELDLSLTVRNLLDARYRDYLSRYRLFVDDPGRDVVLRARIPFGRHT